MTLPPAFHRRPTLGQFAKDGAWEAAWAFPPAQPPSPERLHDYLAGTPELAFEAFFGDAFLGLRLRGEPPAVAAQARACVDALREAADGIDFLTRLAAGLGLPGHYAFAGPPDFAEVGAVNAWRSVGGFRIEPPSRLLDDFEGVWQALAASPVGRDTVHRKAIEFAGSRPLPHWFALPVGRADAPEVLDAGALRAAVAVVLGRGA